MLSDNKYPQTIVIGGPTSSGKSDLAVALARRTDGAVINADAMQLYREIPILSGQPGTAERGEIPHALYGVLSIAEQSNAASWQKLARLHIDWAYRNGKRPIIVGGTGLYLRALIDGLSDMPDIPTEIRDQVRDMMRVRSAPALHAELAKRDPAMAARLHKTDTQRICRALEFVLATGQSLTDFQGNRQTGDASKRAFKTVVLLPPRNEVYARCNARLDNMIASGALDEIRAIESMPPLPSTTALKAKGIPELRAFARGEIDLDAAREIAKAKTRQYAKRQYTWFRNQVAADLVLDRVAQADTIGDMVERIVHDR